MRSWGGLPVLLPPEEPNPSAILESVDGLIFSGGGDLDPATYHGPQHPAIGMVDPHRDSFEIALSQLALDSDIPLLGICRGVGVLNVASGGSLITHIPDEFGESVMHSVQSTPSIEHLVQIEPHSRLAKIVRSTEVIVVSEHHQAVRTVGAGWRVVAHATDGVIEAIEHEQHPWAIALQWHPELALDNGKQQRIFHAFVEAVHERKSVSKNKQLLTVCNR